MTHEYESNPEFLALLAEEMSQKELRLLLQRLGEKEFAEPLPTIGAVIEATGADVQTVASLLADIRNTDFQDRIQKALRPTELKVAHLEKRTEELDDRIDGLESLHRKQIVSSGVGPYSLGATSAKQEVRVSDWDKQAYGFDLDFFPDNPMVRLAIIGGAILLIVIAAVTLR